MDAFKIAVKIFADQDVFSGNEFLPLFQRWIQDQSLPGHLLIDVADYAHVADGPGTVLVSSQANISTDRANHRLGLSYFRKLPLDGTFRDRLRQVLAAALGAAAKLEAEPSLAGRLKFRADQLLIRIHDRLEAPNTAETFAAIEPDINAVARMVFGAPSVKIEHHSSPATLFEALATSAQSSSLQAMLDRVGAPL